MCVCVCVCVCDTVCVCVCGKPPPPPPPPGIDVPYLFQLSHPKNTGAEGASLERSNIQILHQVPSLEGQLAIRMHFDQFKMAAHRVHLLERDYVLCGYHVYNDRWEP